MGLDEVLRLLIKEHLGVKDKDIKPDAHFVKDLGADSLDSVELIMAVEKQFGVEIPDEEAENLQTVGDLVKYLEARLGHEPTDPEETH
jgi:acyl carrier protein